jgi:hypothetical protein
MMIKLIEELINDAKAASAVIKEISATFGNVFVDKNVPLDDRWELFKVAIDERIYFNENCGCEGPMMQELNMTFYDHLYVDRYATITMPEYYERVAEHIEETYTDEKVAEVMKLDLKEQILSEGYSQFYHDW